MFGLNLSGIGSALVSPSRGGLPLPFTASLPSGVTYSRAGTVMAPDAAGLVTAFAADAPPRSDLGLLLETAATNLALRSQEIGTAPWSAAFATFTANAGVAPDGTTTADAIISAANNNQHRTDQTTTIAAAQHTFSVYLKANGYNYAWLRIGSVGAYFNLSTGVASNADSGITARTVQAANGFWRCIITVATSAANATLRINTFETAATPTFTGDGVSGLLAWGAQLETGAVASSYIPTAGSTAGRSLPTAAIPVPTGFTRVRAIYGSSLTSVVVGGLTPGGSLDLVTGRPWLGLGNDLRSLEWVS